MEIKIDVYKFDNGKEPFTEWFESLDLVTQAIISGRLTRIRGGNFGSCKPLAGYQGLYEIVIDYGPGYRVYYGKDGLKIVIILVGGEKKTQKRDIARAYRYLIEHKDGTS